MVNTRMTDENYSVLQTVEKIFGTKTTVRHYLDEKQTGMIDLATAENSPREGVNSYATIGLSDYPFGSLPGGISLGVEIVAASYQNFELFPKIITDCALSIIHSQVRFHPGAVFKNVISLHFPDFDMKHILFVPPYGWEQEFLTLELLSKQVAWLMALPISEAEWKFYKETESGDLEDLFEEQQIDVFDLKRRSVI